MNYGLSGDTEEIDGGVSRKWMIICIFQLSVEQSTWGMSRKRAKMLLTSLDTQVNFRSFFLFCQRKWCPALIKQN